MAENIIAGYREAMARGAQRGPAKLGAGVVPGGGEEVLQRDAAEVEGSNRTEDVVRPLADGEGSSRMVEAA